MVQTSTCLFNGTHNFGSWEGLDQFINNPIDVVVRSEESLFLRRFETGLIAGG